MIGSAKANEGSYVLHSSPLPAFGSVASLISVNASYSENKLWHYRLGHPSSSRIVVIHKGYPSVTCKPMSHLCDICHYAK